ncbi:MULTISPECIES: hypothetical protein [Pseudomonas]|uniref:hypothetical protein n=1 Tax=Pseudomonas TaxID=286 RepID=UPI001294FAD5|nr:MULTISPECIES: hypothetical protein [Pseudomonas]MQU53408.1 hypothetical protein [Pseudomonas sp. FSL R10-1339]WOL28683.1 hypothetical protein Q1A94_03355 [Pseudomonas fragi]
MQEDSSNNDLDEDVFQNTVSAVIENKKIEASMDSLTRILDDHMFSVHGEENSQGIIDTYLEALLNGNIAKNTITKLATDIILSKDLATKKDNSLQLAIIYTALSQYFLNKNLESKAWTALSEAKYFLAYLFGLTDPVNHKRTERAQKGGRKKAQNALDFEQLVITLLNKKRPRRGWRNAYDAANDIASELSIQANENNIPIPNDIKELVSKVINLIREHDEVIKAFDSPES